MGRQFPLLTAASTPSHPPPDAHPLGRPVKTGKMNKLQTLQFQFRGPTLSGLSFSPKALEIQL